MYVRNWGKFLFCALLVCLILLSISSSFAADDMDMNFTSQGSDYGDSVDLSVSNDDYYSDSISSLKSSSDHDVPILGDDEVVDDGAFNGDEPWVENLEEDSHDGELEPISGFEGLCWRV